MRITLITMAYPHPRAGFWPGIERQVGDFAAALRDAGAGITVITSFRNGGPSSELHEGIRILRVPDTGQRYGRLGYLGGMHVRSLGANALKLGDVIRESDVIESFVPLPPLPAPAGRRPALVAFFAHRDRPARLADYLVLSGQFGLFRDFFRRTDTVIVASAESRRVLIEEYGVQPARIEVVPLGVSPRFLPGPGEAPGETPGGRGGDGAATLLYVGPLIRRKGLRTLVAALGLLRAGGRPARCVLAGHGPEKEDLLAMARRLGVADLVEFPGFVAEGDLPALYRGADLFVFPSTKEGFGLVLVEAMACGVPIVASSAPPIPEVVGEAALLFAPENPEDLAAAIGRALDDPGLRRRLAAEGLARVRERYSWGAVAERTLGLFSRMRAAA